MRCAQCDCTPQEAPLRLLSEAWGPVAASYICEACCPTLHSSAGEASWDDLPEPEVAE